MHQTDPKVEELFFAALELGSSEARAAFLDRQCGDTALRRQVEELLALDPEANDFLEVPASAPTATVALDSCADVEAPGATIGPYKLLETIGEGGMGTVYMAEQAEPVRRRVALKVIKPGMDSKQVVARFEAERQALAMMDHPNIAKVHDAGATPSGRPYFVMELVRGIPITEYCDHERRSVPERLELFVLVCRAVQHAHQKGVIHRDLKPSNILVTVIDGVATPKVIDFGIAKATGGALTDRTLFTGFHQLVGTPLYMSPEQAELSGVDVDTRSDVYALGVLLYELLTGTTPIDAETFRRAAFDEMRRLVREEEPPTPSTRLATLGAERRSDVSAARHADARRLGRSLRGELDWIVMRALEKDRRRRYETANAFAADVLRRLADEPVEACPPSARYRFAKFVRRNRAILTAAGLLAVVSVGATVAGGALLWQEKERTRRALLQARAHASVANERLSLARRSVDEMYTRVAEDWLADQPALTPLQRQFLEKALAIYEQLAIEDQSDPDITNDVMRSLIRVGAVRRTLGQHAAAKDAVGRAVSLGEALVVRHPRRPEYRLGLAEARIETAVLRRTGTSHRRMGGTIVTLNGQEVTIGTNANDGSSAAEEELRSAIRDLDASGTATLPDAEDRRRLAEARSRLSEELTLHRMIPEAGTSIEAALASWRSLVEKHPDEIEHRFGLARAYSSLGIHFMWWVGEFDKAAAAFHEAEVQLSRLCEERPSDALFRETLADALINRGVILGRSERHAEAEAASRQAVALFERLAADFPDVPKRQNGLATALGNLSSDVRNQGRLDESEELLARSLSIREVLADRYPDEPEHEWSYGAALKGAASIRERRGDYAGARRFLERCVLRARASLERRPDLRDARMNLAFALQPLPRIALRLGDHAAASTAVEEWSRIVVSDLGADELAQSVALLCEAQLEVDGHEGESDDDREARLQQARLRFKSLVEEAQRRGLDPHPDLHMLADALSTAPEGFRDPELALELARRSVELDPRTGARWQSLGWAQYRAGELTGCLESLAKEPGYSENGDPFAAMALWGRGESSKARDVLARFGRWLAGYEARWKPNVYPPPAMFERARSEAAALIGGDPPP